MQWKRIHGGAECSTWNKAPDLKGTSAVVAGVNLEPRASPGARAPANSGRFWRAAESAALIKTCRLGSVRSSYAEIPEVATLISGCLLGL